MSDSVLNKYLAPSNGDEDFEYIEDDEHMPPPPRTPNPYRPLDDTMDPSIESENESPPASQSEPRHKTASYAKDTFKENERQSPPKSPVRDYLTTDLVPPKTRKRKHSYDTIASFEFKRQKTEESILKLEKHLKQKTCPKSLQYKARANIPPDDIFQKEIRAIKNNAEQQFVSALVRFHKRRSQSHAKKLNRAKTARTRNSTDADISHQETQSSEHNVKNDVNRIDNLEKQISRIENILCKHLINNNKRVESYQSVISEKTAKHSTTTTSQRQTKSSKRKHRRLNTAQRRTAIERETNEKYLKNLSDTPLTDDQVGVISKGLKFIPTPVTDKNKIRQQLR